MVKALPELVWEDIEIKKVRSYRSDSADYQVRISFRNAGQLPTAFRQAHLVKIVKEDRMILEFDTTGVANNSLPYRILPEEKSLPVIKQQIIRQPVTIPWRKQKCLLIFSSPGVA